MENSRGSAQRTAAFLLVAVTTTCGMMYAWGAAEAAAVAGCGAAPAAIFAFGNSLSDTGNCARSQDPAAIAFCNRTRSLPYGETFPGHGFCRFSDGLLLLDYLSTWLGLRLIRPYLDEYADFTHGIDYAYAGAPALPVSFLNSMGIFTTTNVSLDEQLSWHLGVKAAVESSPGKFIPGKPALLAFHEGLYVVEIGGNDYLAAIVAGKSPEYIEQNLVPLVARKIRDAIELLYATGARKFLVITVTPFGCLPPVLATRNGTKDKYGCLVEYNAISFDHATQVLELVSHLRETYPGAKFTYFDYYGVHEYFLEHSFKYGFFDTLDACCGAGPGSPNNFDLLQFCGAGSYVCRDPSTYLNWDGFHFTHAYNYQAFALTFLQGQFLDPASPFGVCNN